MKLYRVSSTAVLEGIRLTEHPTFGLVVALGERGRGRWLECIKVDGKRPPSICEIDQEKVVFEADLFSFQTGSRARHSLILSEAGDTGRVLLEVCTGPKCLQAAQGKVERFNGSPWHRSSGRGGLGETGRLGQWEHALWTLKKDDAVLVLPADGAEPYVVSFDGEQVRTTRDFRA